MQVDFDLNARFFLGGGYLGSTGPWSGNAVVAGGGRVDRPFTWWNAPALARLHILEGWASADGNHGELLIFGADASRVYPTPLLRITTFFGAKPRRYDPPLYFGLWGEALRMEFLETESGKNFDRIMYASGGVTVDTWRSRDLSDFVRVRLGAGVEEALGGEWGSFVPHAAIEGEVTFGSYGFHHVRAMAQAEVLTSSGEALPDALPGNRSRFTVKGEYEVFLFALNNQPITLALEAKAVKRDDVPDYTTGWVAQAGAQLRFSAWAPPRRDAKTQDKL